MNKEERLKTLMDKKIRKIGGATQRNNEKIDGIKREIRNVRKALWKREQKSKSYNDLSLRLNDLEELKNVTINNLEKVKQTILEKQELNKTLKPNMNEIRKKNITFLKKTGLILQSILKGCEKKTRLTLVCFMN